MSLSVEEAIYEGTRAAVDAWPEDPTITSYELMVTVLNAVHDSLTPDDFGDEANTRRWEKETWRETVLYGLAALLTSINHDYNLHTEAETIALFEEGVRALYSKGEA